MKHLRILIAEDHQVVSEGFRLLLELEPDFEVIGEARDGRRVTALAAKLRPDILLMDIAMPRLNGLEATRQILKLLPAAKVIILSAYNDSAYVQNAIESGASGYLLKQASNMDVCKAIREVASGRTSFSPSISMHLGELKGRQPSQGGRAAGLTSREMEVLQLIAEGKANKETAAELGIGIKTVEKHREHLMEKLDIHDTAGLTRYAIRTGVIESGGPLAGS